MNSVLNRTISDGRLTLLPDPEYDEQFYLCRVESAQRASLELRGTSARLFVGQAIEIDGGHVKTNSATYRYQLTEETSSWLIRWEYFRDRPRPDYEYPLAHVHVNGDFHDDEVAASLRKPLPHLHIPTARVAMEHVIGI